MSDDTPRLKLPKLVSMQGADPVTWAKALGKIDALTDLYLLGQFVNTPPASPAEGDSYLTGGAPTGAWNGSLYKIATWSSGVWRIDEPFNGLRAYVATTGAFIVYLGGTWTDWNSLISANEVSVASAATCDLGAAGSLFVQITGTTAITSFGTGANKLRFVRFAGALTLTHNATSLILLGGANRSTAAGDVGIYASDASGNWRERAYFRAAANAGDAATKSGAETLANKTLSSAMLTGTTTIGSSGAQFDSTGTLTTSDGTVTSSMGGAIWSFNRSTGPSYLRASQAGGYFALVTNGRSVSLANSNLALLPDQSSTFYGTLNSRSVIPTSDNTYDLGSASYRWGTVYAATGTINTSGAAAKTNARTLSGAELAAAKALAANVRVFQFCDAVAKKGAAARLHIGMIYEDVVAAFAAEGLDPLRYGIVCRDPAMRADGDTEEPDLDDSGAQKCVLGLRYDELAQFVMAGLAARLAALEAK